MGVGRWRLGDRCGQDREVDLESVLKEHAAFLEAADRRRLEQRRERLAERTHPRSVAQVTLRIIDEKPQVNVGKVVCAAPYPPAPASRRGNGADIDLSTRPGGHLIEERTDPTIHVGEATTTESNAPAGCEPASGNRMVAANRAVSSAATQHRPSTGTHVVACSAVEQRLVVDLGVGAEREQVVLGGDDFRVAEPLRDLGQRVALLREQRAAPLAQAVRREVRASRSPCRRGASGRVVTQSVTQSLIRG
jgi:hypothetical protein